MFDIKIIISFTKDFEYDGHVSQLLIALLIILVLIKGDNTWN